MSEDQHQRVEQMASAIEDLLQMGIMKLENKSDGKAMLSPQFSQVVSNVMTDMKLGFGSSNDEIMKMMYYSLLIFMTEHLKVPRSFMMALGNDMEKNRENMESGELVTTYVSILAEVWTRGIKDAAKN
ncbi:MAG TPA: hypothetical protein VJ742_06480 [Nitrososphaera sp.]|jgi:hypothetical protein|nr:hypothetical protein [Nitrososphaera sp.]